jgi:hypothetical protein
MEHRPADLHDISSYMVGPVLHRGACWAVSFRLSRTLSAFNMSGPYLGDILAPLRDCGLYIQTCKSVFTFKLCADSAFISGARPLPREGPATPDAYCQLSRDQRILLALYVF